MKGDFLMNSILKDTETRMDGAVKHLSDEYASIRAGRANTAILDKVSIEYYGTPTPINQVAAISVAEARVIVIQPWDMSSLSAIEKAIQKSDIGINPQNDGKVIRLIFPQLTEDRRREISKEISRLAEETKISIRNIRRDAMDKSKALKKNSEATEDEIKKLEKKVQDFTDKSCAKIDKLCSEKIAKTMEI